MTLLFKYGFKLRYLFRAIFPIVLGLGVLSGFNIWLEITGKTPELYSNQIHILRDMIINHELSARLIARNGFIALMYLGLFLLPISILLSSTKAKIKKSIKAIIPLSILLTIGVIIIGKLMPMAGNILNKTGSGALTLRDTYSLKLPHFPALPKEFWVIVTILSVLGCTLILIYIISRIIIVVSDIRQLRKDNDCIATFFFLSGAFVYFLPLALLGFRDRYLIPLIVLISLALVSFGKISRSLYSRSNVMIAITTCLMISLAFFSVATTHDYLSWNRARWIALRSLLENENIPPSQIDGGFEFNGLYIYSDNHLRDKTKGFWWVIDDTYLLAFGEVQGYEAVRDYEYTRWIPPSKSKIFILRRQVKPQLETGENNAEHL